eukprot:TRINITY_DN12302_c0_g1_i3.p1 TRINITY_DN12302_c0_g1~~TRINITY_DN12302_c0_g1_i3.p1  ORF type:complete len:309 (+),score=30.93 TRINITY_DN12302_c0_g1_i3:177-1103(+)
MPGSDLPTWVNLLGGGLGAAAGSTATGPLEVVKTRMQSSKYAYTKPNADAPWIYRNSVTLRALTTTLRDEGVLSLWRGLGPTLVGIIPSRACYFAMYNGSKPLVAKLNDGHENSAVHLGAGLIAGIVTSTVTSPIWVIKTRVQLANMQGSSSSFDVIRSTWQQEGFKGFFKGLAASYAGVFESAIQFTLYEYFKKELHVDRADGSVDKVKMVSSSIMAKAVACISTYPHEVVRTRMREPPGQGVEVYRGFFHCLASIYKHEGAQALYAGMPTHLLRSVPNAVIVFMTYEWVAATYRKRFARAASLGSE